MLSRKAAIQNLCTYTNACVCFHNLSVKQKKNKTTAQILLCTKKTYFVLVPSFFYHFVYTSLAMRAHPCVRVCVFFSSSTTYTSNTSFFRSFILLCTNFLKKIPLFSLGFWVVQITNYRKYSKSSDYLHDILLKFTKFFAFFSFFLRKLL